VPVAVPVSWLESDDIDEYLQQSEFYFGLGYDYRRAFGPIRQGDYYLGFSACPACCRRAVELGLAEEVEDVGWCTNALSAVLLSGAEALLGFLDDEED